ncbi:hypothetical protein UPYG_G00054360 [Umbra pygmaea]|uniref:CD97 antigen-like n=1 Tax=Umbra pygmaea TaxID=75934 RepID=A0ABD0XB17_UMBPY
MRSRTILFILSLQLNLLVTTEVQGCEMGFKSVKGKCVDEDECTDWDSGLACGSNAMCLNTNGSYYCECQPGFRSTTKEDRFTPPGQCIDINECTVNGDSCCYYTKCINTIGSYRCECQPGYIFVNQSIHPECKHCEVLNCDQFKADKTAGQAVSRLDALLSVMENSCLALGNSTEGAVTGEVLLKSVIKEMDGLLSLGLLGNSWELSRFLDIVENAMRLIGPQLKDNHTRIYTNHTGAELAVRRGQTPPTGQISLANENAQLETNWKTVTGNGSYPGFAVVGLITYKNLESSVNNSFQDLKHTSTDTATDTASFSEPRYQIGSKVVTALVSNSETNDLDQPVLLTFKHLKVKAESAEMNYTCVFWEGGRDQNGGGAWSKRGCTKVMSNSTHTQCSCQHLSSFAVLMALYPMEHTFALNLLTWVGLSVSLVCLLLCILTFWLCRAIKGTRTTIHLHLCVCLFIADLVFLAGISQTQNKGGCGLVAGLLHFFFLGSFSWMLLEGVQLYQMVMLVFTSAIRPLYLYAVGYGLPLIIVLISAAAYPDGYGTKQYCWLSLEKGFIWSFFGPVCTIIIFNAFFFIITVWRLAQKFSSLNPDLSNLNKIKAFTVTAVAQLCILGCMWIFGVFQFQEEGTRVMTYLFTILNSLQGALVFIMHCLMNKTVRDEYSKLLSCTRTKQKSYSDYSSSHPFSSQESRKGPNTAESDI